MTKQISCIDKWYALVFKSLMDTSYASCESALTFPKDLVLIA